MARVLLLIALFLLAIWALSPYLVETGVQEIDLAWFSLGALFALIIAFLIYQVHVWRNNTATLFEARKASLKDGPSAFHILRDAIRSGFYITMALVLIFVVYMFYMGRQDELFTFGEYVGTKGRKLIDFLSTP